jgi:hypothetical protein
VELLILNLSLSFSKRFFAKYQRYETIGIFNQVPAEVDVGLQLAEAAEHVSSIILKLFCRVDAFRFYQSAIHSGAIGTIHEVQRYSWLRTYE